MNARLQTMLRKLTDAAVAPYIPAGQRVYAVGDIHGCADLLLQLQEKIVRDAAGYRGKKTIVYLGDYIDRGEKSRQVIDILLSRTLPDFEVVCLLGNHEQLMLDFMALPKRNAHWLILGGFETLKSYGIRPRFLPNLGGVPRMAEQLLEQLPDSHGDFLRACSESWSCGSYHFVHAGVRPGVELENQTMEDELWIRKEFLASNSNHGAIVVHGHNTSAEPRLLPNRIGIDTGACTTGVLTCLILQGEQQRLLQATHSQSTLHVVH